MLVEQVCEVGGGLVIECSVCKDGILNCMQCVMGSRSVQVVEDVGRVMDVLRSVDGKPFAIVQSGCEKCMNKSFCCRKDE